MDLYRNVIISGDSADRIERLQRVVDQLHRERVAPACVALHDYKGELRAFVRAHVSESSRVGWALRQAWADQNEPTTAVKPIFVDKECA